MFSRKAPARRLAACGQKEKETVGSLEWVIRRKIVGPQEVKVKQHD